MTSTDMAKLIKLLAIRLNQLEENFNKILEDLSYEHGIDLETYDITDEELIAQKELDSMLKKFKEDILNEE